MRVRWIVPVALIALFAVACDGDDAELTTNSTIVTGPTGSQAGDETSTTASGGEGTSGATPTTLVGETVSAFEIVNRIPNDNGEEQHIVIPNGAYTDVDLENFVIELIDSNPDVYGAEIFDDAAAADAFVVDDADRTEEQNALLERHHFVTLVARDRIEFNGPFSEFPGGAIGS